MIIKLLAVLGTLALVTLLAFIVALVVIIIDDKLN